jgi:hypothetical protein
LSLLILSRAKDFHSLAVAQAIASIGGTARHLADDDLPARLAVSIEPTKADARLTTAEWTANLRDFDFVWNRRYGNAVLPDTLHPDDREIAQRESDGLLMDVRRLGQFAPDRQIWANPPLSQDVYDHKAVQLRFAADCGFAIPETLISMEPDRVRDFVARWGECVVKPIHGMSWHSPGDRRSMPARLVGPSLLQRDSSIRACPMIYQQPIAKKSELRVVAFGSELLAVQIRRKRPPPGGVDWRSAERSEVELTEVNIDQSLATALRLYCDRAGLIHCSFDVVIDEAGKPWFLECNVQGQSLWLEDFNPKIKVLRRLVMMFALPGEFPEELLAEIALNKGLH